MRGIIIIGDVCTVGGWWCRGGGWGLVSAKCVLFLDTFSCTDHNRNCIVSTNCLQATVQLPGKLSQLCIWQWNCHSSAPGSETVTALHLAVKLSQLCTWQWNCHSSATGSETVTALHLAVKLSQLRFCVQVLERRWEKERERGGSESLLTSFADDFGRVNSAVCTARHKSSQENFTKTTLLSKQIFWPDQADACFSWIATRKKCCFTSTETVGLLGTGAQDGHLNFHTAPELWIASQSPFLYVWFTLVDSTGRLVAAMNLAIQYSSPLVPYSLLCSVEVAHVHQSPLSHWWFQKEIVLPPPCLLFWPLAGNLGHLT